MNWLWTWNGKSFGYRDGDLLWTRGGNNVGRFYDDEVFGADGRYLGETRSGRLIRNKAKRSQRQSPFAPRGSRVAYVDRMDYVGNVMLAEYEDFPLLK